MNVSDITARFIKFYEYCIDEKKVRSTAEFAKNTGMTRGGLAEIIKGKNFVGLKTVMNTLHYYTDLNRYWLLFGEQEMLNIEPTQEKSTEDNFINNPVIVELLTTEIERLRKELQEKGRDEKGTA